MTLSIWWTILQACAPSNNTLVDDIHEALTAGPDLISADEERALKDQHQIAGDHERIDLMVDALADDFINESESQGLIAAGLSAEEFKKYAWNYDFTAAQIARFGDWMSPDKEERDALFAKLESIDFTHMTPETRYQISQKLDDTVLAKYDIDPETTLAAIKLYGKLAPNRPLPDAFTAMLAPEFSCKTQNGIGSADLVAAVFEVTKNSANPDWNKYYLERLVLSLNEPGRNSLTGEQEDFAAQAPVAQFKAVYNRISRDARGDLLAIIIRSKRSDAKDVMEWVLSDKSDDRHLVWHTFAAIQVNTGWEDFLIKHWPQSQSQTERDEINSAMEHIDWAPGKVRKFMTNESGLTTAEWANLAKKLNVTGNGEDRKFLAAHAGDTDKARAVYYTLAVYALNEAEAKRVPDLPREFIDAATDRVNGGGDPQSPLRSNAFLILISMGGEHLAEMIIKYLDDPSERITKACEDWIKKHESESASALITYAGKASPQSCARGLTLLGAMKDPKALDAIVAIALNRRETTLLVVAEKILSAKGDAAIPALVAALEGPHYPFEALLFANAQKAQKELRAKMAANPPKETSAIGFAYAVLAWGYLQEKGKAVDPKTAFDLLQTARELAPQNAYVLFVAGYVIEQRTGESAISYVAVPTAPAKKEASPKTTALESEKTLDEICASLKAPEVPSKAPRAISGTAINPDVERIFTNSTDPQVRLSNLLAFLEKEDTALTDADLAYVIKNMPHGESWGKAANGSPHLRAALTDGDLTEWGARDFEPLDLDIVYLALMKTATHTSSSRLETLKTEVRKILEASYGWASSKEAYKAEVFEIIARQFKRIEGLPVTATFEGEAMKAAAAKYLAALEQNPACNEAYEGLKRLSGQFDGLTDMLYRADYLRQTLP